MMKIRYGTYTLLGDIEISVTEYYGHGLSQEFEENHRKLSYSKELGYLKGFTFDTTTNRYKKDVLVSELKNAFFVVTKAKYQGEVFEVEPYYGDEIHLHLATKDLELGKKLNFYELHDGEGNSYYLGEVKITEVEKIWEERQKSSLDIPLPESFELYKEIKLESE